MTLMYITNNPKVAQIAQTAGVDRIWVDMEYIGKDERQFGLDTVKSHHTVEDVQKIRPIVSKSELLVRVNPMHAPSKDFSGSKEEIERTISAGANVIMLPMFRKRKEVEQFLGIVKGRAKTLLLFETPEAVKNIDDILNVKGIDEVHIGLNDLHLGYHKKFMFELLCDGTVQKLCEKFEAKNLKYGFGGIARVGYGLLPAEYIIAEHYRLGSTAAILSRSFCDANRVGNADEVAGNFIDGVARIREKEKEVSRYSHEQFAKNQQIVIRIVNEIVHKMR